MNDRRIKFNQKQRQIILSKTDCTCAHCGKGLDIDSMTIDHVFPVSKGGLNDEYNLLPLCFDCNEAKSDSVYYIRDYYKNIKKEEYNKFYLYNNFASFDYVSKSIIGFDEMIFTMIPTAYKLTLSRMMKRGAKKKDIAKFSQNVSVKLILRKAFPANAEEIYKLIEYNRENGYMKNNLYKSDIDVLNDIENGSAYILEKNDKICGAFLFKHIRNLDLPLDSLQLTDVRENFGLKPRYVMSCAIVNKFAADAFDDIMSFFESMMIQNRMVPMFFDIINVCHKEKNRCIQLPVVVNNVNVRLEFFPVRYLKDTYRDMVENVFKRNGYKDVPFEDVDIFADVFLKYSKQCQWKDEEDIVEFFEKYKELKMYFKPDTFELYNVGFVH